MLYTNIMYLKASSVKISTIFGEKLGNEAMDHAIDL